MLYNTKTQAVKKSTDCLACEFWDTALKKCSGLGEVCFEYDPKTNKIIDAKTKKTYLVKN